MVERTLRTRQFKQKARGCKKELKCFYGKGKLQGTKELMPETSESLAEADLCFLAVKKPWKHMLSAILFERRQEWRYQGTPYRLANKHSISSPGQLPLGSFRRASAIVLSCINSTIRHAAINPSPAKWRQLVECGVLSLPNHRELPSMFMRQHGEAVEVAVKFH